MHTASIPCLPSHVLIKNVMPMQREQIILYRFDVSTLRKGDMTGVLSCGSAALGQPLSTPVLKIHRVRQDNKGPLSRGR